ncbi:hypothetical protein FNU79_16355 [Deinococcus detaillensis]|uniref:Lipoprotein n=1 Tax=Deinococcus detaillensis TaxID=2592048 RepID=A0A553UK82_9DEIO|nr:hypothetical protein [Deinococcus detaillensis]TSA80597.1 hypothetical protein FNU79_16355 [Deinococcus detaillensis]
MKNYTTTAALIFLGSVLLASCGSTTPANTGGGTTPPTTTNPPVGGNPENPKTAQTMSGQIILSQTGSRQTGIPDSRAADALLTFSSPGSNTAINAQLASLSDAASGVPVQSSTKVIKEGSKYVYALKLPENPTLLAPNPFIDMAVKSQTKCTAASVNISQPSAKAALSGLELSSLTGDGSLSINVTENAATKTTTSAYLMYSDSDVNVSANAVCSGDTTGNTGTETLSINMQLVKGWNLVTQATTFGPSTTTFNYTSSTNLNNLTLTPRGL